MTHVPVRLSRFFALLVIVAVVATGTILGQASDAAWAKDYPSWTDVQNARNNEAAKKNQIAQLEALLKQLEANVVATQAIAEEKGQAYFEAQLAYDEASFKAAQLQTQADEAQVAADESMRKAGQLIARLQRAGGNDLPTNLFFNEDGAENLLSQLGMATKVSQQSAGIYTKAKQDQNTAQSLTDQANVAKEALKGLAEAAEKAMAEAQAAADAATAALEEQSAHKATLQAQLATLVQNRQVTEAEYVKGVEASWGVGAGSSGPVSSTGWTRPANGSASVDSYGWRVPPFNGASTLHAGTDFGVGCNQPIFAAHSGRVNFAGDNGGYGNFIKIDHGNNLSTGYAHIVNGGILVHNGQDVVVGQMIARVGTTGTSNGCHLHFEVRQSNDTTNPVLFLRAQGVNI